MTQKNEIGQAVKQVLERYFRDLDGELPNAVYDMVSTHVEHAMLETVMEYAKGNQTLAANILGINRNTLRRKLTTYRLL
jgi:Fis family transcriptional regulator